MNDKKKNIVEVEETVAPALEEKVSTKKSKKEVAVELAVVAGVSAFTSVLTTFIYKKLSNSKIFRKKSGKNCCHKETCEKDGEKVEK